MSSNVEGQNIWKISIISCEKPEQRIFGQLEVWIWGSYHAVKITEEENKKRTRDYFDATASNWNSSAHSAPWRVSLYKDWQSNRRVFSRFDHVICGGPKYTNFLASGRGKIKSPFSDCWYLARFGRNGRKSRKIMKFGLTLTPPQQNF